MRNDDNRLSLRDNLPHMVRTKNAIGLFLFTLLFAEASILCVLFWFLGGALWLANTPLCSSAACGGVVNGLFAYVNILTGLCVGVVVYSKRVLGIGILDAFGL